MEIFLNDYKDNEPELAKKEEVLEEIALVTIVDPKTNHENVEVIIRNDLQNGNQIEEKRFNPRAEERVELKTLEQNGITEKRNMSFIEATRAMLAENDVSKMFWRESIYTIVYTMNRVQVRKDTNKTPYELWFGHSPTVKFFRIFGNK